MNGFIDGDQVEKFLDLPLDRQETLLQEEGLQGNQEERDEIARVLEEMKMLR